MSNGNLTKLTTLLAFSVFAGLLIYSGFSRVKAQPSSIESAYDWRLPKGFPIPRVPVDNPMTTAKVELADKYNDYAGKAAKMGLLDKKDANLDQYVTQKALDGLFLMVAEQEKAIRKDPVSTGSALLKKIFGG